MGQIQIYLLKNHEITYNKLLEHCANYFQKSIIQEYSKQEVHLVVSRQIKQMEDLKLLQDMKINTMYFATIKAKIIEIL